MQFGYRDGKEAIPVLSTQEDDMVIADIPDALLMQSRELVCYIYLEEEGSGLTIYEIVMPIVPRIKPGENVYTPKQINNFDTLVSYFNTLFVHNLESSVSPEVILDVAGLLTELAGLSSDVAELNGDLTSLTGDVNTLTGNVTTLSGNLSTLSGDVNTLSDTLSEDIDTRAKKTDIAPEFNSTDSYTAGQ